MNCRSSNARPTWSGLLLFAALSLGATACGDSEGETDTGVIVDTGVGRDAGGPVDTGIHPDATVPTDTGVRDTGTPDTGTTDTGIPIDSGADAGPTDTGTVTTDAGTDAGILDGSVTSSCSNNLAEAAEVCDGTDLRNTSCEDLGFGAGTLACATDCASFVTAGCAGAPVCPNGTAEGNEACDGTDLRNFTCVGLGFESGTLACAANCTLDTSGCVAPAGCGNGVIEADEVCDDGNLTVGDGCSGGCNIEPPYNCTGQPSNCVIGPDLGTLTIGGTLSTNGGPLADNDLYFYRLTVAEDLLIDGTLINAVTSTTGDMDFGLLFNDGTGWRFVFTSVTEGLGAAGNEDFLSGLIPAGDYVVLIVNIEGAGVVPSYALTLTGVARVVPANWTCDPEFFADNACDCGCGVADSDCVDANVASCQYCDACGGDPFEPNCTLWVQPTDTTQCLIADCGNGTIEGDEACDDGNLISGDGCSDLCEIETPATWTCNPNYFGGGDGCDCGCGVVDPDCANATTAACGFCTNAGSCNTGSGCPGNIDPANNAVCLAPACGDGTLDSGEQCDDGNTTPGDGCDGNCQLEAGDITVSATPALAIPDDDAIGVSTTLNVPATPACVLAGTRVPMDITHTWRGDLILDLTSPAGTTVRLHNRTGSSADDIVGTYGVDLTSAEPLAAFNGEDPAGDWTLLVSDNGGGDLGTVNGWGLTLNCQ